jgi:chemotaxis signal transduction protein
MDGEEVLARMRADPELAGIPVIIVSSEKERGEACLASGAQAFVHKPYRKDDLLLVVGRVLAEVQARTRKASIAVLPVGVGPHELAIDLAAVRQVVSMTETLPLPGESDHVREYFELYGEVVCVLDLAARLDVAYAEPLVDRMLVVLGGPVPAVAVCVDRVREPVELPVADVAIVAAGAAEPAAELARALRAGKRGPLPVVDSRALVAPALRERLPALVADAIFAGVTTDGDVL